MFFRSSTSHNFNYVRPEIGAKKHETEQFRTFYLINFTKCEIMNVLINAYYVKLNIDSINN